MKYIFGILLMIAVISMNTVSAEPVNKDNPSSTSSLSVGERDRMRGEHENSGSLWSDEKPQSSLFSDFRANKVGDILTVRIVESSKGNKNASTSTEKDSSISTSLSALFGLPTDKLSKGSVGAETSEKFDGAGSTSRSSQLSAVMTAKVLDVLPNGNLIIDGKREVIVNNETQMITINGVIRPEDIGQSNTILSSYIADARITYTGSGVIGDKQRVGWLVRIIDFIWPF